MNDIIELTPEEESYLEPLIERYKPKRQRPEFVNRTVSFLVFRLQRFLDDLKHGYRLTIDDFKHDVQAREILEEVRAAAPASVIIKLDPVLRSFDDRFRELTVEIDKPTLGRRPGQWWWHRIPRDTSQSPDLEDFLRERPRPLSTAES